MLLQGMGLGHRLKTFFNISFGSFGSSSFDDDFGGFFDDAFVFVIDADKTANAEGGGGAFITYCFASPPLGVCATLSKLLITFLVACTKSFDVKMSDICFFTLARDDFNSLISSSRLRRLADECSTFSVQQSSSSDLFLLLLLLLLPPLSLSLLLTIFCAGD